MLIALLLACAAAQAPPKTELEVLAENAVGAPPELAADMLIRIAESGKLPGWNQRLDLLETAFDLAGRAKFRYALVGAIGISTDTDAAVTSRALEPGLDTLSLQSRVVEAMLPLERARALELFDRIPLQRFEPLTCRDALKPRVDRYYGLVRQVFEKGYSAQERKKGWPVAMLEREVRGIATPVQLDPLARLLRAVPLDSPDLARLVGGYAAAMKQISAGGRSFAATGHSLTQAIYDLAGLCRKREISTSALVDAYRSFLVRHLRGPRCADTNIGNTVELFNDSLRRSAQDLADVRPITEDETTPASTEGKAEVYQFWEKPATRPLLMRLKELRFGTKEQQAELAKQPPRADRLAPFLSVEQRRDPVWEGKVRDYLKDLEAWQRDQDETPVNFFHEMCFIYVPLIELIPPGRLRETVIASYIGFLRGHPMQKENPPEWLLEFRRMFQLTDSTAEERAAIREQARRSGDRLMALYLDLDRLAPPAGTR